MSARMEGGASENPGLKERWDQLSTKTKTFAVMGGGLGAVLLLAGTLTSEPSKGPAAAQVQARIDNALIPKEKVNDLGSAAVSQDLRDSAKRVRDLEGEVARLKQMMEKGASGDAAGAQTTQRIQAELQQIRTEMSNLSKGVGSGGAAGPTSTIASANRPQPAGTIGGQPGVPGLGGGEQAAMPMSPAFGQQRTIGGPNEQQRAAVAIAPSAPKLPEGFYLPSGSIIRGVLLNGVDAPTGRAAMKDPVPVLARIKHDAILPNRYRADVKECFVILDAIGDLPSERVMMRTSTLSCVRKDRTVIDMALKAYAIGEDGRAGLRGTVINKQGAIIAKALIAGFAEGASNAFGGNSNMMTPVGQNGEVQIDLGRSGRSGVMGGASSALDRIAAYYLDLADQMHPIIEIDSARRVSLVILQGSQVGGALPGQPRGGPQTAPQGPRPAVASAPVNR